MSFSVSPATLYRVPTVTVHWVASTLIIWGFALGCIMIDIPAIMPTTLRNVSCHKWTGVTVFVIVPIRLIWRATHRSADLSSADASLGKARGAFRPPDAISVDGGDSRYRFRIAPQRGFRFSVSASCPPSMLIDLDDTLKAVLKSAHVKFNYVLRAVVAGHLLAVVKHVYSTGSKS